MHHTCSGTDLGNKLRGGDFFMDNKFGHDFVNQAN